ncbi:MAG: copper-binding protein [Phycisphaerales bacterium]|nr:copper-binding protein [Phycisphaerales bacterium]
MSRVLFAAVLGFSSLIAACGGKDKSAEPPSTGQTPPAKAPDATYTVRGEVASLPIAGDKRTDFRVHHEAIPSFKDKDGKVVGMASMTMEFPPAKGVDLSKLKIGDEVVVTFSVWWGTTPPWLALKVEKLPDDTTLDLGSPSGSGTAVK